MGNRIVLPFADGVYAFALAWGQLRELQEKTDAGPMEIYRRLLDGSWRFDDVRETIRLALIGGGQGWMGGDLDERGEPLDGIEVKVDPAKANKLVRAYVDTYAAPFQDPELPPVPDQPRPWASSAFLAAQIMGAGLSGVKDEPLGKKPPGEESKKSLSLTESGDGLVSFPLSPIEAGPDKP